MKIYDFLITTKLTSKIRHVWDNCHVSTVTPNTISLSRHEQVYFMRLLFERYFSHHWETQMIILRIYKGNMQFWMETIKLADNKKFHNVTS